MRAYRVLRTPDAKLDGEPYLERKLPSIKDDFGTDLYFLYQSVALQAVDTFAERREILAASVFQQQSRDIT